MDTLASHTGGSGATTWSPPLPDAPGFEHAMVSTPGLRTHVATIGEGEPVLMLHGFPQHWWEWRDVAPRIAGEGYRVVCPDLRGSGWTETDDARIRRDSMMQDTIALLDALGVERTHLVSHDLGSVVAGQLAYAHPDRIRTAVQLSVPPGFMTFSPKLLPAFAHMPPLLMHREGRSLTWLFSDHYAARPIPDGVVDGYLRTHSRAGSDAAVRELYRGMIIPEVVRLAAGHYKRRRLRPPTLAVFGRKDGPFTEKTVRRICRGHERHADRFDLAFVDDAAHFIVDDEPDAVTAHILDWFRHEG